MFSLLTSTKLPVPAVVFWMKINRVTLRHDREFIMCRFYFPIFMVLLCVIFKSVWYVRAAFWVLLHAMFMYDWKQAAKRLKLRERLLTISKINSVKHAQRQQFSFTKTSIEGKVSLKIIRQVSIGLKNKILEAEDELEARKSLRAFLLQSKS